MPEHLRALIFVLLIAGTVFHFARPAAISLVPVATFTRWRNLWLLMTLALFLSHSFWIYALVVAAYALANLRREPHLVGLYFALLFVAPPAVAIVPGLGLVNFLFVLTQYRLLALVLLLPVAIALFQRSSTARIGHSPVDWMVIGYLVVISALNFRGTNLTSGLRDALMYFVDIFLPYYVVSRSLKDMDGFRHALLGFVLGGMVLSALAAFEVLRNWWLYSALLGALGLNPMEFGLYLYRANLLRPIATVGNSIVLGYIAMVALGYFLFLKDALKSKYQVVAGFVLLGGGVLASLSRGPWVGAVFLLTLYLLTGPQPIRKLLRLGLLTVGAVFLLSLTSRGQVLVDMLPFVGQVDEFNVQYRANLLTTALPVIERHFWFGSVDFLQAPELQVMIQGQGIIDIVNSYIFVALQAGMVGLAFFVGMFVFALKNVRQAYLKAAPLGPQVHLLGRALFATLGATMLVIYTVSGISAVPTVYWSLVGLCVAYAAFVQRELKALTPSRTGRPA